MGQPPGRVLRSSVTDVSARFRVYFQFFTDKVWTVVLNTEHEVEFRFLDDGRVHVPNRSTR